MARWLTSEVPPCGGTIKALPEDFVVEEVPAYLPAGDGEHLFLWIEKRGVDTPGVVRALAKGLGLPEREIGYAGLKDRHAVTRQWFSVNAKVAEPRLPALELPGARVLEARRHRNKLRTGHLRGNRFTVRIRGVQDAGAARAAFETLVQRGVPNFFGAQRFGMRGDNAAAGRLLLKGERLAVKPDRFRRKLFLSAVQSALFNQALEARLEAGTWTTALRGDVLRKNENGGLFVCKEPAVDQLRLDAWELSVAGPIFGPKMPAAEGAVAEAEQALLAAEGLSLTDFVRGGDETLGARRAYRIRLEEPAFELEGADVRVAFTLTRGSYATVVLDELIKSGADAPSEASEPD